MCVLFFCPAGIDQPLRVMIEEPRQIQTTVGANVRLVCVAISYSSEVCHFISDFRLLLILLLFF